MASLIKSAPAIPKDTTFPFPWSKDSIHLLLRLSEVHVYIQDSILGYVILLPLVNRGTFDIYRLFLIPILLNGKQFLYIDTDKPFLWIDRVRQYYFLTESDWMNSCNLLSSRSYVCKKNETLLSSQPQENCVVLLLQSRGNIPASCDKRVVELSNSVWTQLDSNAWIYFVPRSERITILCRGKPPVGITISGIRRLGLSPECKGFGKSVLFQTHSVLNLGVEGYESDFLSKVLLDYDCFEALNVKVNLSAISVNTSFKYVVSHIDDLRVASRRISEVETMIMEQEWRQLHSVSQHKYSALVYISLSIIGLHVIYKLHTLQGKGSLYWVSY
jgi:hypothetical protein